MSNEKMLPDKNGGGKTLMEIWAMEIQALEFDRRGATATNTMSPSKPIAERTRSANG